MKTSTWAQLIAAAIAQFFSVTSLILVLIWAGKSEIDEGFLGGFKTQGTKLEKFNLHPVYMVASLIFLNSTAMLSWRTFPVSENWNRAIHGVTQTVGLIIMSLGLRHAFDYEFATGSASLYTVHGWLGILVVSLHSANYLGGVLVNANPWVDAATKLTYKPMHQFLGLFTFVLACFQVMGGIQQKNINNGSCEYSVKSADYDPAEYYQKISDGCQLSNGLGYVVFLLCLTTLYACMDLQLGRQGADGDAPLSKYSDTEVFYQESMEATGGFFEEVQGLPAGAVDYISSSASYFQSQSNDEEVL